jgi:hypothetical protein
VTRVREASGLRGVTPRQWLNLGRLFGVFLLLVMPPNAWTYRPFVSTDAAVADPQEVEIELGYFWGAR